MSEAIISKPIGKQIQAEVSAMPNKAKETQETSAQSGLTGIAGASQALVNGLMQLGVGTVLAFFLWILIQNVLDNHKADTAMHSDKFEMLTKEVRDTQKAIERQQTILDRGQENVIRMIGILQDMQWEIKGVKQKTMGAP